MPPLSLKLHTGCAVSCSVVGFSAERGLRETPDKMSLMEDISSCQEGSEESNVGVCLPLFFLKRAFLDEMEEV